MTASTDFWAARTLAGPFKTLEESRASLAARAAMYPDLERFMPTDMPGKTIIDYGAGPGHDTLLFLEHGAELVYAIDISEVALSVLEHRLALHGLSDRAEILCLSDAHPTIKAMLEASLPRADHLHCAGTLHHLDDPIGVLRSFHTAQPETVRVMCYDGDSEYVRSHGGPANFATTNTGDNGAPIANAWTQTQFAELCAEAGWDAEYLGGYRYRGESEDGPPLSGCWALTTKETR